MLTLLLVTRYRNQEMEASMRTMNKNEIVMSGYALQRLLERWREFAVVVADSSSAVAEAYRRCTCELEELLVRAQDEDDLPF